MTLSIIKIFAIFVAQRLKKKLAYAVMALICMAALIYSIPPNVAAHAAMNMLAHPRTIKLILITGIIKPAGKIPVNIHPLFQRGDNASLLADSSPRGYLREKLT